MRPSRLLVIALLWALHVVAGAEPMHFSIFAPCRGSSSACGEQVLAQGDIEADTPKQFAAFLKSKTFKDNYAPSQMTIAMNSPGGNVVAAVTLGYMIRKLGANTYLASAYDEEESNAVMRPIARNVVCASACTFAFLGGVQRQIEDGSRFGVHQFSSETDVGDSVTQNTMVHLAAYIEEMGADRSMLDYAGLTTPDKIYWIPMAKLHELQIDNTTAPLAPWVLSATSKGEPLLSVRQRVAPDKDAALAVIIRKESLRIVVVAEFGPLTKAGSTDRFPLGDTTEVRLLADGRPLRIAPAGPWAKFDEDKRSISYAIALDIPDAEAGKLLRAKTLQLDDGFPNALRDQSIATQFSVDKLQTGLTLMLHTKGVSPAAPAAPPPPASVAAAPPAQGSPPQYAYTPTPPPLAVWPPRQGATSSAAAATSAPPAPGTPPPLTVFPPQGNGGGPSGGYAARIAAAVRPNVVYPNASTVPGNPTAEFTVSLAPDGTILNAVLTTQSGFPDWDAAAQAGLLKTERLPRDIDGRIFPRLVVVMQPKR